MDLSNTEPEPEPPGHEFAAPAEQKVARTRRIVSFLSRNWKKCLVVFLTSLTIGFNIVGNEWTFGFFVLPLQEEFGWSRAEIIGSKTVSFCTSSIFGPAVGLVMDKYGLKTVNLAMMFFPAVGFVIRGFLQNLGIFYFSFFISHIAFWGSQMVAGAVASRDFPQYRTQCVGFVMSMSNVTSLVLSPLMPILIEVIGWRNTCFVLAGIFTLYFILVALFQQGHTKTTDSTMGKKNVADTLELENLEKLGRVQFSVIPEVDVEGVEIRYAIASPRTRKIAFQKKKSIFFSTTRGIVPDLDPKAHVAGLTVREAIRSRQYCFISASGILAQLSITGVLPNLVPHFLSEGHSTRTAAWILTVVSGVGIAGKLCVGYLAGRIGARRTCIINYISLIGGLLILTFYGDTNDWVWVGAVVYGFGFGNVMVLNILCIQEAVGNKKFGTLLGITQMVVFVVGFVGPIYTGIMFDQHGDYILAFVLTCSLWGVGFLCAMLAGQKYRF